MDYDGVSHPEPVHRHPRHGAFLREELAVAGHVLFEHAQLLEELLRPYPDVLIVLSTSWVLQYRFAETAKRLPPALRERCIGATFHSVAMNKHAFRKLPRGAQVLGDVARWRPTAWLAVDDTDEGWDTTAREQVVLCHPVHGVAHAAALPLLQRRLAEHFSDRARS